MYIKDTVKIVGKWWSNRAIKLVEINQRVFALYGWNGECFTSCWECFGKFNCESDNKKYVVRPVYSFDLEELKIVGYEIV